LKTMSMRLNKMAALVVLGFLMAAGPIHAQESASGPASSAARQTAKAAPSKAHMVPHKFLEGENLALFAGVAAVRALDFTSTQHFRERGHNEVLLTNGIVDNKPLFATIEVAGTAASIGLSYLLHRTGHHRAERWVSIVHIGVATFGDIRNYGLSNPQYNAAVP
jgi:hypothetical protein